MATIYIMLRRAIVMQTIVAVCVSSVNPIVNTTKGQVEGFTKTENGENVSVFLGIPYAKPPTAMLRFKPPESPDSWNSSGVLNATFSKPACPQNTNAVPKAVGPEFKITDTNEDCLYLDMYIPGTLEAAKANPLPIIVFWHGGGFQIASGSLWDGSPLAVYGNVVVILMNFRIGVLGFLSTEDSAAPGNWGLLDQRLALQWIQDNIHEFGGDKTRVTIFGHASGAFSVGLHILSPMSRGLFARGISQGGTITSPALLNTNPRARVKPLAMKVKCLSNTDGDFPSEEVVACLRNVSVSELLKEDATIAGTFTATIDKHFLPDDPTAMLKLGNFSHVDYIIGGNSDEGTNIANRIKNFYTGSGLNESDFDKYVTNALPLALKKPIPETAASALTSMIASKYYPREATLVGFRRSYLDVLDHIMISKIFETATYYSKTGKVFIFYFTHKPSASRFPDYVGPGHNEEIRFIFGYTLQNGTEEEKMLSRDWMKTWGEFARTGNPNFNNGTLTWTPCTAPDLGYLEITANMTNQNLKTMWRPGVRRFWNEAVQDVAKLGQATPHMTTPQMTTSQPTVTKNGDRSTEIASWNVALDGGALPGESRHLASMTGVRYNSLL